MLRCRQHLFSEKSFSPILNFTLPENSNRKDEETRRNSHLLNVTNNNGNMNGFQNMDNMRHGCRHYHSTAKKEILPLIAVAVGVTGYYSIRALKRMDADYKDYQESLKEFNLEHGIEDESESDGEEIGGKTYANGDASAASNSFREGTLAIDLGSLNVRIAHKPYERPGSTNNEGTSSGSVIVNREGARSTSNHIAYESDGSFLVGNLAAAKFYERANASNPVINPGQLLRDHTSNADIDSSFKNQMLEEVISSCAQNALERILGGDRISSGSKSLFTIDSGIGGVYNVKPVFTYPPSTDAYLRGYQNALNKLSYPDSIATFIPEPVSAVRAANSLSLLSAKEGPIMVIDVGASTTSLSIIINGNTGSGSEQVECYSTLQGFGGETLVECLMDYLSKSFFQMKHKDVNDTMAVQRLYDAAKGAVMEISSQKSSPSRVQINIPYLSVDEKMQPKHLDLGLSAKILKAEFNDAVAKHIIPEFAAKQDVLSASMQHPDDLASLFSSMIMRILEQSGQNPFALNHVLVVGGGARSIIIQKAIQDACTTLAGEQFVQERVVIPRDELIEELVVLGGTCTCTV